MPARKTDWKKERAAMQEADPDAAIKGKELLAAGKRQSLRNDLGGKATSMDVLLRMWEENRKARTAVKKKQTNLQQLKGLFGGGG